MSKLPRTNVNQFDLNSYLALFKSKELKKQCFSPYFILGTILSVASAPELIKLSDWYPLLSKDEDEPIVFSNAEQSNQFFSSIMSW